MFLNHRLPLEFISLWSMKSGAQMKLDIGKEIFVNYINGLPADKAVVYVYIDKNLIIFEHPNWKLQNQKYHNLIDVRLSISIPPNYQHHCTLCKKLVF